MKVAVVRNRDNNGIVSHFGQPCPEVYGKATVQKVIDAVRAGGHTVAVFEGDKRLIANLEQFMPPDSQTGQPGGIALNMAYGIQGDSRYAHVPGMLEMAGIPYTGSSPAGHALSLDKVVTKILMRQAGVPTPNYQVMSRPGERADNLRFPLIVKPRHESTSYGLHFVRDGHELEQAVRDIVTKYQQDALVEEYIAGREICVGLLGNDPVELLPAVELDFENRQLQVLTWGDKYHKNSDEPEKICPVEVGREMRDRLNELSLATFRACQCKDYARVDIRIDASGNPFVLEINSMASLGRGGAFVLAAKNAGYSFESLISRILDVAHIRYFGAPAPTGTRPVETQSQAGPVSPSERTDAPSESAGQQQPSLGQATEKRAASAADSACNRYVSQQQPIDNQIPPCKVTPFYDERLRRSAYYEELKRIVEPSLAECEGPGTLDTSGERDHTKMKGLQHKYPQTVLLLVTDQCFSYCRFCFRKRLVGQQSEEIVRDYGEVSEYIKEHLEITDVLLSGGDPFVLGTEELHSILDHLLPISHLTSVRFGTRGIIYDPLRFQDKSLAELFRRISTAGKVPVIVTHIDHFGEVSEETELAVRKLLTLGVQFFNQTVLLRDVNDAPDTLATTFGKLHSLGVRPYYLFQARPVRGTSHFQVPLGRGTEILRDVNRRLSGIQKTYRYVMSHYSGKIEILAVGADSRFYMRYHQSIAPERAGVIFSRPHCENACWLDDLPCFSEVCETV
ncbi:MAG TPA: ATP-grasp domain-containing protein [Sedimentisphaerales bacterium]|nr:ATP-grasp domain-containing protein [Sedimentisphaerales bacterium]